jgi:sn1-specific diacylglycerol lipase
LAFIVLVCVPVQHQGDRDQLRTYGLVITGHSLGAGTAVLLAMMLRAAYPSVRCLSYGTPNSVVDTRTAEELNTYVTSVVINHDLVCRLSFTSLHSLRSKVLKNIARCKVNKMYILQAIYKEVEENEVMHDKDKIPESAFNTLVEKFETYVAEKTVVSIKCLDLCIPGKVIHFMQDKNTAEYKDRSKRSSGLCAKKPLYQAYRARRDAFKEIHVSVSMGFDHLPDKYLLETQRLLAHWNTKPKNV